MNMSNSINKSRLHMLIFCIVALGMTLLVLQQWYVTVSAIDALYANSYYYDIKLRDL